MTTEQKIQKEFMEYREGMPYSPHNFISGIDGLILGFMVKKLAELEDKVNGILLGKQWAYKQNYPHAEGAIDHARFEAYKLAPMAEEIDMQMMADIALTEEVESLIEHWNNTEVQWGNDQDYKDMVNLQSRIMFLILKVNLPFEKYKDVKVHEYNYGKLKIG